MSDQCFLKTRPLSPHLGIYRLPISAIMSILHRITGVALFIGLLIFSWFLSAYALFTDYFSDLSFSTNIAVIFFFVVWTTSFYYHMLNGIRHLFWDCGVGFKISAVNLSGFIVIGFSIILTCISWFIILSW